MTPLKATLAPRTAFATPLMGDTLFGQLCWAIRHGWGETRLTELLLDGFTAGRPFLVVSDAFPAGYLPMPALPSRYWREEADPSRRKALKRRVWLAEKELAQPLGDWQRLAKTSEEGGAAAESRAQPRNSLNRLTLATGKGAGFAPYTVRQHWYPPGARLDIHLRLDEARLSQADLGQALDAVGVTGFGKDANVGLGKFTLEGLQTHIPPHQPDANAWLTLALCAPQGLGLDAQRSYYRPFTRYGRHGAEAVLLGNPFKAPLLLAAAGAVFSPGSSGSEMDVPFIGQGLGGEGQLSKVLRRTVHQGYAPVVGIHLPQGEGQ
ncbi:MAG: CRISPR-associated protein Csm7 [Gammaproteobacteria bacterium]|nr:CRISPR-associated protein Csm7 [Gammaproteobacteria bacterium]